MSSLETTASFAFETPSPRPDAGTGAGTGLGGVRDWPWSVVRWLFGKGEEGREEQAAPRTVARFQNICVSRETGAGGGAIARMVGQRLGWKVYDQELLEAIAHRMELPVDDVRVFDELAPSVVQDWLLPLREEYYAPQEAYLDHLAKLLEAIGRAGESVLVGRGAGFLMPRETTLSVRIIAPIRHRALRLAERMGVSVWTARRAARDLDRRRAQFDRTMHRAVSGDPHNYDLVLDSHSLGLDIAAEVIVRAVEAGRPGAARTTPPSWTAPIAAAPRPEADGPRLALPTFPPADLDDATNADADAAIDPDADANAARPADATPLADEPGTGPAD
ncbi:cytidylate kinase [Aquisphaera giovannonii]|uniref:Cytidylate kinase n=1 Tax=Aquisphaera giovannonii TaxID=406548 RepID=A0A5B9W429_9BACT|nr:cytidylate kinase-like family protein [Aquisphaera giovannonii]QEH35338.1 cytidylate kinase [Aquisphaera giovannonii]